MKFSHLEFTGVKGVGSIEVDFSPDKSVYAFIGENGVGKTKFLEVLFQALLSTNKHVNGFFGKYLQENKGEKSNQIINLNVDNSCSYKTILYSFLGIVGNNSYNLFSVSPSSSLNIFSRKKIVNHDNPVIFIAAQNRGFIKNTPEKTFSAIGNFRQRRDNYIGSLFVGMKNNFSNLNMNEDIEQWFIRIAQSSNPFQKKKDNREIEVYKVLELCHKIDQSIDSSFMEIGGDNRVFFKINGEETQLSHLSTGYASILKIIQSIVSGYGYFTNEQQLQQVRGIVLIDEIESHLHLSWQSKIIPILKKLFPNTTFYITTHSPIVLTQLEDGEAYRLQRENDGVVRSNKIDHPGNATLVDVLDDAFKLDLNQQKLQKAPTIEQQQAKQDLLNFVKKQRELSSK